MANINKTIQLLRNKALYASHKDALDALKAKLKESTFDGQPILARYKVGETEHTLLGIKSGNGYEIFDNEGTQSAAVTSVQYDPEAKKITYTKNGQDADVVTLAAVATSGTAADVAIADADGRITADNVEGAIAEIAVELTNINGKIATMDKDASAVDGQVVTTVSETSGVVSETKANVKDLKLGGYTKDASATGAIGGTDTINTALSKLENTVGANKISNADKSIVVTEPAGGTTTTDIKVNIKSGDKVIKLGEDGIYTKLNLVKVTDSLPVTVKDRYEFRDSDNNKIGESIDIAKDSHIVSIEYDEETQKLIYKYLDASGVTQTTAIDMAHLILESEVENGIQSFNGKLSIKLDTTGDDTGDGKFLTVGANGLKLDGVTDAIAAAIDALDVTDAATAGQYVSSVSETDGKIVVTRANVSDAVLNGYAKGEKPASTEIAATDDVKGAIAKLEHQIDDAKASATTKVKKDAQASHLTLASSTADDGSVTYTIGESDIASKADLDAEIAARKAVDGQDGQTYAANTSANYISGATSLNDADVKLAAALKAADDAMLTGVAAGNGISVSNKSGKSQTITAVAVADDPIIKVTANGIATKEDAVWDCGSY